MHYSSDYLVHVYVYLAYLMQGCVCVCACSEAVQELHALPFHQCAATSTSA